MTIRADAPRFDLADTEFLRDPYPTYRRFRAEPGLVRGGPGQWVVSRHAEVFELLRDPRLGREFPAQYQQLSVGPGPAADFLQRIVIDRDPDEHTRIRRLLTRAMKADVVRRIPASVSAAVDRLTERIRDEERFDGFADLAQPLPVAVMSDLFALPAEVRDRVERWSVALAKAFAVFLPDEDRRAAHRAVAELRDYFAALASERRRKPGDDLLSCMITASNGDLRLSAEEIVDNALFVYYAGYETTTNLIATGCAALARHPDQFRRLLEPLEVAGRKIRPGRVLVLVLASANYDEERYPDPDTFDVGRRPNPQLSFGGGVHHCLGAALARSEAGAAFGRLVEMISDLRLDGDLVWNPAGGGFRYPYCAYESVPLRVEFAG
ncbi:cytochrome P450 [Micromonospora sp. NPDC051925]|uniref:cytochrome P450 n=1 Tax=Micromonospora sp. NPDC051925 TaxID=3364288 RepID=UPI0037C5A665